MARRPKPVKKKPAHDWYFREWTKALGIDFPHAWLQKNLDYSDGKSSNVLTGKKRYDRDLVNEIAAKMNIEPYELLMPPADAMAIRQLRASAAQIRAVASNTPAPAPAVAERAG